MSGGSSAADVAGRRAIMADTTKIGTANLVHAIMGVPARTEIIVFRLMEVKKGPFPL
jgi:hypothetical protein